MHSNTPTSLANRDSPSAMLQTSLATSSNSLLTTSGINWVLLIILAVFTTLSGEVNAARLRWIGNGPGNWDNPKNWSSEGVIPREGDEASIAKGHAILGSAMVNTLIFEGQLDSGRLEVLETALIRNSVFAKGNELHLPSLTVTSLDGVAKSTVVTGGSKIFNHGFFEIFTDLPLQFDGAATFINRSTPNSRNVSARFVVNREVFPDTPPTPKIYQIMDIGTEPSEFINNNGEFINRTPNRSIILDINFRNSGKVIAEKGSIVLVKDGVHGAETVDPLANIETSFNAEAENEIRFRDSHHVFSSTNEPIGFTGKTVWEGGQYSLESGPMNNPLSFQDLQIITNQESERRETHILGKGRLVPRTLTYSPSVENTKLHLHRDVELHTSSATVSGGNSTIVNHGTWRVQNSIVIEKSNQIRNVEKGFLILDSARVGTNLNPGGIFNSGTVEIKNRENKVWSQFDGSTGELHLPSGEAGQPSSACFTGQVSLGDIAIEGKGRLIFSAEDLTRPHAISLGGELSGPEGSIEFQSPSNIISGQASWNGPNILVSGTKVINEIQFATSSENRWRFISSTPTSITWKNSNSPRLRGPLTIENEASELTLLMDSTSQLTLESVTLENHASFRWPKGDIQLRGSEWINTDEIVIGSQAREPFTVARISLLKESRISNSPDALLTLRNRLGFIISGSDTGSPTSRFESSGEILVDGDRQEHAPDDSLLFENLACRINGSVEIRGDSPSLSFKEATADLGSQFQLVGNGGRLPDLKIQNTKINLASDLVVRDFHVPGTKHQDIRNFTNELTLTLGKEVRGRMFTVLDFFPAEIGLQDSGHLLGVSNLRINLLPPAGFSPDENKTTEFVILNFDSISSVTPENFDLSRLPGNPSNYEVVVSNKKARLYIITDQLAGDSEFNSGYESFLKQHFGDKPRSQDISPLGDADGDGRSNFNEYATGTDPRTPDSSGVELDATEENGNRTLRMLVPKSPTATGIDFNFKQGPSVDAPFSPFETTPSIRDFQGPNGERIQFYEFSLPILPNGSSFFQMEIVPLPQPPTAP